MHHPAANYAKPFIPEKDFKTSLDFYKTIGFEVVFEGEGIASLQVGKPPTQRHYSKI
ncbi:MAG: hypothetical protein ACQKBV_10060 [Puniceicoccales bacterium]